MRWQLPAQFMLRGNVLWVLRRTKLLWYSVLSMCVDLIAVTLGSCSCLGQLRRDGTLPCLCIKCVYAEKISFQSKRAVSALKARIQPYMRPIVTIHSNTMQRENICRVPLPEHTETFNAQSRRLHQLARRDTLLFTTIEEPVALRNDLTPLS